MAGYIVPDLRSFPDCISLTDTARCTRLNVTYCQGKTCPFRKTLEEADKSKEDSNMRIRKLDTTKQMHIANKYFEGSMPWDIEKII